METVLVPTGPDPLLVGHLRCAGPVPSPVVARLSEDHLEVDETLPERLRRRLAELGPDERPPTVLLAAGDGVDPLGPDPYLQSASFLTAAAALESGARLALITRGVPARGFRPLFRRYPGYVRAQVAVGLPPFEPAGSAPWAARLGGLGELAGAGVPTWLRLDPAVPGRGDDEATLRSWIEPAAAAGASGIVVAPLVLDEPGRELVGDDSSVVDYYRPGRRRRRGAVPAPLAPYLPLERETALVWRVRQVAEDVGLPIRLCRCLRTGRGSCGLAAPPAQPGSRRTDPQLSLWAG